MMWAGCWGIPEAAQTALKAKIDAGMLGRKTGFGFYEWEDKKAVRARADYPAEELEDLASALLAPMIDKCRSAVAQGIVASRDDADIGCILGIGFPGYRGGPPGWADYPRDLRAQHAPCPYRFFADLAAYCGGWSGLAAPA